MAIFDNSRWRTAAILKIALSLYLSRELSDFDHIWHADAISIPRVDFWPKIEILLIQDGGQTPYWKSFLAISRHHHIGRLIRNLKICRRGSEYVFDHVTWFFHAKLLFDNSASFTSWRMKDLCPKWKVTLIFRGAWNSSSWWLYVPDWPWPVTTPPYFTTDLRHCPALFLPRTIRDWNYLPSDHSLRRCYRFQIARK